MVTVSALSDGLDKAQDEVLQPLTGVGTDLSVARPLDIGDGGGGGGGGPFGNLSQEEQEQLREENGGGGCAWTISVSTARASPAPTS